jgi:hypothetical protein
MSKVTVALGSFVVGALSMLLVLSGSRTSVVADALGQTVVARTGSTILAGRPPIVPPLSSRLPSCLISDSTLVIDGANFDECVFKNATLEYGGGSWRFGKVSFSGTTRVNFIGAAANTVVFLKLLSALGANQQPRPVKPKTPIPQIAATKRSITFAFKSPY